MGFVSSNEVKKPINEGNPVNKKLDAQGKRLTEPQLKLSIENVFDEYDRDHNGYLDVDQVAIMLKNSLGVDHVEQRQILEFVNATDTNGDNRIQKHEMFNLYKKIYC